MRGVYLGQTDGFGCDGLESDAEHGPEDDSRRIRRREDGLARRQAERAMRSTTGRRALPVILLTGDAVDDLGVADLAKGKRQAGRKPGVEAERQGDLQHEYIGHRACDGARRKSAMSANSMHGLAPHSMLNTRLPVGKPSGVGVATVRQCNRIDGGSDRKGTVALLTAGLKIGTKYVVVEL